MDFKLNYNYYLRVFYKKDINPRSHLKSADNLLTKLQKLIIIYRKNFHIVEKLPK